ncbi:MAG: glycosyltransferase family 4 protein [Oceanospirillaceae bacterium]|nr:glycosyltransferase family 4 protein [Oceanospirillaceae bacterium]
MATIWYISKYVTPPAAAKVGARGFLILREFVRAGHKALLITSDSNHLATPPKLCTARLNETVDSVDVHWLRTRKYSGARSLARVLSWFDFEWQVLRMPKQDLPMPDVVIVSSLSLLTIFNGLLLRHRYGCKLVLEIRDIWPLILTTAGRMSPRHPAVKFLAWVERLAYRRADLMVGTMPNLREHVTEVSGSDKPVGFIPQGLDTALLAPPEPLPNGYLDAHIPRNKFIVCHAGSIGADNALETLLACARVMTDRQDIHFLLVGEGYLKNRFVAEVADLDNVSFAPGVPKDAVQSVLQHVDLVYFAVHKSPMMRFGQSLNKVIDYMLSGKPVLASFTGYPSMINEAECGSYVPAEDVEALREEIERYVAMPVEKREWLGARGRDWLLKNRKFEKLSQDYLHLLGLNGRCEP